MYLVFTTNWGHKEVKIIYKKGIIIKIYLQLKICSMYDFFSKAMGSL